MNRILTFLLSCVLSLSLTACGEAPGTAQEPTQNTQPPAQQAEMQSPPETEPVIDWEGRNYEYTVEELPAEVDGHSIYGRIYLPVGAEGPVPAVIFSHGYGGNNSTGAPYARELAQKGIIAYCYDFRGGSNSSRSDGSPLEMSVFTEKEDLEAVLAILQSMDNVDTDNIFLMGTSQGGMVFAMVGDAHPDEIKGMMLLYPAFCIPEDARARYASADQVPDKLSFFSWLTVGQNYVTDVWDYDVYADVTTYDKDILILHGDRDGTVDVSYSERAAEQYPSAELEIISGAGHGFSGGNFDLAMGYLFDYLEQHIS